MENISNIFPKEKKVKKHPDLTVLLKGHVDPDAWVVKTFGNSPILVIDNYQTIYIIIGKEMLASSHAVNLPAMVAALLGSFYLPDFDYLKVHELGLSMLHYLCSTTY